MRPTFLLAAFALLLRPERASAFVVNGGAQSHVPSKLPGGAHRWSVPAAASGIDGLGGGIAWILDDDFCTNMIGHFPERNLFYGLEISAIQFVHCSDIRDAIQRGFATWAANHRLISFSDISASGPCSESSSYTGELSDTCPWELYIGTDDGESNPGLAAYVINHRTSSMNPDWFDKPLRSSAGEVAYGVDAHARSVMKFQTHLCWYLDATFCYYFQILHEEHQIDVLLIVRTVLLAVFGMAALRVSSILFWCLVALFCLRGKRTTSIRKRSGCSTSCSACLDYLSSLSPFCNVFVLFLVIFPPVFYERIFMPCWECYDFEAAMAHETGHVLGFGHPDAVPAENLAAACRITNATCHDPFAACAYNSPYASEQKSIMHSLTQHTPRACLSEEDMHGLYFLYPLCDDLEPEVVSCTKGRRLSGWLRLALVSGAPFLLAVLVILVPLGCLRWRDQRIMRQLDRELGNAQSTIREYQSELTQALRSTARDTLARPATALRNAGLGRSGRIAPTPTIAVSQSGRAQVQPTGGGRRGGGRRGGEAAAAVAKRGGGRAVAGDAMVVEEIADGASGESPPRRAKPGKPKVRLREPATMGKPIQGQPVPRGAPVGMQSQASFHGYTGVAWPGAPAPR